MLFTVVVKTIMVERCVQGPFLCQPSMGKSSLHGEFCAGTGHQRVSQLHSCGPTAQGLSINTMLWGMETQLCINKVDGQDAETGLFTPVLQHPTSIQRHARGNSVIPGGDGFPLSRDSGSGAKTGGVCLCTLNTESRVFIPCTSWFQEDRGIQIYSESLHCLQKIPHVNYKTVNGASANRAIG